MKKFILAIIVVLSLAACGGGAGQSGRYQGSVVLINGSVDFPADAPAYADFTISVTNQGGSYINNLPTEIRVEGALANGAAYSITNTVDYLAAGQTWTHITRVPLSRIVPGAHLVQWMVWDGLFAAALKEETVDFR